MVLKNQVIKQIAFKREFLHVRNNVKLGWLGWSIQYAAVAAAANVTRSRARPSLTSWNVGENDRHTRD